MQKCLAYQLILYIPLQNIPILLDEQLKANATINKSYTVDYNNSNEGDKNIRLKELVDLRVHWNPLKIIFDDGTIAE